MAKVLIVLLIALVVEAVGVVYIKKGLTEIGEVEKVSLGEIARIVVQGITNKHILFGVALEAAFFGALLYLLSQRDVSLIWPLTSLGFVITAIAAKFIVHEQVTPLRWAGVALIVAGAVLVSWSEQAKEPPAKRVTANESAAPSP